MIDTFVKDYELQYRDMNANSRLSIPSLLNYLLYTPILQEAQMRSNGITQGVNFFWILNQWDIKTYSIMPSYSEILTVETWAVAFTKLYALRKFKAYNKEKELVAEADTYWLLMDIKERKLATITEDICKTWNSEISEDKIRPLKLQLQENYEKQYPIKVGNTNIDILNHVYNICYVEWALNYISFEVLTNYKLDKMVVSYLKETYLYEDITVSIKCVKEENDSVKYFHKLSKNDGTVVCLMESIWIK